MKILIYGANGWIGGQFTKYLDSQNIEYVKAKGRCDNETVVNQEITKYNPTHVISLIGRTSGIYNGSQINTIDYLEKPGNLSINIRDNLFSPIILALMCKKYNVHYTYLGTGCIFNYDGEHCEESEIGYKESDIPNFTGSAYSTVKGFTDRLMHQLPVLNLRIRMPITADSSPRNFITKILKYEKICSVPNSMTVLRDFYPIWLDLMKKQKLGTYNCTNPGVISHNEILEMYRDIVDPTFTWSNFTIEEQTLLLDAGRSNNRLDTDKIEAEYPEIKDIKTSVRQVIETMSLNCE